MNEQTILERIASLQTGMAQGVKAVTFQGVSTEYPSVTEYLAAITKLESQLSAIRNNKDPNQTSGTTVTQIKLGETLSW